MKLKLISPRVQSVATQPVSRYFPKKRVNRQDTTQMQPLVTHLRVAWLCQEAPSSPSGNACQRLFRTSIFIYLFIHYRFILYHFNFFFVLIYFYLFIYLFPFPSLVLGFSLLYILPYVVTLSLFSTVAFFILSGFPVRIKSVSFIVFPLGLLQVHFLFSFFFVKNVHDS